MSTSINTVAGASNISGNVGSCETHVAEVVTARKGFFVNETKNITTNSCTGISESFPSWGLTFEGGLSLFVGPLLFVLIVAGLFGGL